MEKGVEINFEIRSSENIIVKALASLTWLELKHSIDMKFQIFHVSKGENRFYRVLFAGPKLSKFHPMNQRTVREKFDQLGNMNEENIISLYKEEVKKGSIKDVEIKEVREEYDLWQDPIWQYI
ncbi:MAG: hypothetical protein QXN66_05565 [Thermoplasmatales archaeon]